MVWVMARANRLSGVGADGRVFHLTHRCHNRAFLLKFARDREAYRALVRDHLKCFDLSVLERENLAASLVEKIAQDEAKRQPCWTESLAVGSVGFLEKVKPLIRKRRGQIGRRRAPSRGQICHGAWRRRLAGARSGRVRNRRRQIQPRRG